MQYKIEGSPFPVVICSLRNGETMITQSGAMAWMSPNMKMETTSKGGVTGALGRMFSGESLFLNRYTAIGGDGIIAFSSNFPGEIMPFTVGPGKKLVIQKSAFLASEESVNLAVTFQKKLGSGLFGGEGFIMQELSGVGTAFLEIDGSMKEYELSAGQKVIIDTGYLAAMESTCTMDVQAVSGVKNVLFGGEGLFNTVVTGPGKVFIQTKPISGLANALRPFFPKSSS